ncbi:MAG TPA: carboxypeptidase-like regulatory domain-containing protein [Candidatus Eremiobacteraceae bacterium]|nr:carboxypeptidase-like regulatory domain-containing protein [Candidatus Eremiobacteraceae bacterium]
MKRITVFAMILIGMLVAPALADGGGIRGYVYADDRRVGNALVVVTGPSGVVRTRTNANGFYVVLGLVPGEYHVRALLQDHGLNDCSSQSITVNADEVRDWMVYLDPKTILGLCIPPPKTPLGDPDATADVYDIQ